MELRFTDSYKQNTSKFKYDDGMRLSRRLLASLFLLRRRLMYMRCRGMQKVLMEFSRSQMLISELCDRSDFIVSICFDLNLVNALLPRRWLHFHNY